jgi:hypothetical protein
MTIGLVVGAGAMYLVLRPPWGGGDTTAPVDAGVVAKAPADAGVAKPKGKRPRRPSGGGRQSPGNDFLPDSTDETEPAPTIQLSAADRALEWRGEQTAISRKIDMNAPDTARPLEQGEINSTVSSQSGGVRRCVEQLATGVDLHATITIKMVVEGNGTVSRSQVQAPHYLFEKGLLACAQRALRSMHFPSTGTPTLVTFPVELY